MYESTMDQLFNLYSKVQIGGVIIVDDYTLPECKRAIHDFRGWHNITEPLIVIPGQFPASYWIKQKKVLIQRDRYIPLLSTNNSTKN
jgi:O-methyltransferase